MEVQEHSVPIEVPSLLGGGGRGCRNGGDGETGARRDRRGRGGQGITLTPGRGGEPDGKIFWAALGLAHY